MSCPDPAKVERALWRPGQRGLLSVCTVLDPARDPAILTLLYQNAGRFCCLETARLAPGVRDVSPHLLRLRPGASETSALLARGWGRSWGLFAVVASGLSMEEIRRHFHGLLRVRDEAGRRLIFRFYDPRVARIFLPTCTADQLREVFGPVREYWMEDETGDALLAFSLERGALVQRAISLEGGRRPEDDERVVTPETSADRAPAG